MKFTYHKGASCWVKGRIYRQNHSLDEGQQSTAEKILMSDKMAQYGSSNDYFKVVN